MANVQTPACRDQVVEPESANDRRLAAGDERELCADDLRKPAGVAAEGDQEGVYEPPDLAGRRAGLAQCRHGEHKQPEQLYGRHGQFARVPSCVDIAPESLLVGAREQIEEICEVPQVGI
ncbi:hypothetical protein [Nonomuraea monospora]|uniref:hypothetical protein n=1 Tax=Nonomuraea monospora TaxID=568818 RepID=UPI0031D86904